MSKDLLETATKELFEKFRRSNGGIPPAMDAFVLASQREIMTHMFVSAQQMWRSRPTAPVSKPARVHLSEGLNGAESQMLMQIMTDAHAGDEAAAARRHAAGLDTTRALIGSLFTNIGVTEPTARKLVELVATEG